MKKIIAISILSSILLVSCNSQDLQGRFDSNKKSEKPNKMEAESQDEVVNTSDTTSMEGESQDE